MVSSMSKGGYRRYRMNAWGRKPRKIDERMRNTVRRGKGRGGEPYRYADELPERDFYEGDSPDY